MHAKGMTKGRANVARDSLEPFADRAEAGRLLGSQLLKYQILDPLVIGIPRGGVLVASEVARMLNAELDFVNVRKLLAPGDPDCVVGAVCEDGSSFIDDAVLQQSGTETGQLYRLRHRAMAELGECSRRYREAYPKVPLENRCVILVDDGAETGETMHAAIWTLMKEHPRTIVAALPVAPAYVLDSIAADAGQVVCLRTPTFFQGLDESYFDFSMVDDRQVLASRRDRHAPASMMW